MFIPDGTPEGHDGSFELRDYTPACQQWRSLQFTADTRRQAGLTFGGHGLDTVEVTVVTVNLPAGPIHVP